MKKVFILGVLLCMGYSASAISPLVLKKARKAAYEWVRQYNAAIHLDDRQAKTDFLALFENSDANVFADYNTDFSYTVSASEYVSARQKRDARKKYFYEIKNVRIMSEKCTVSSLNRVESDIIMVMWTGERSELQVTEYELSVCLVYDSVTEVILAKSIQKTGRRNLNPDVATPRPPVNQDLVNRDMKEIEAETKELKLVVGKPAMSVTFLSDNLIKVKIVNPSNKWVRYKVLSTTDNHVVDGRTMGSQLSIEKTLQLPEGQYLVEVMIGDTIISKEISVK